MHIAFQGELGAYSHAAVQQVFATGIPLPCPTFEAAVDAVRQNRAVAAVLPVENSQFGRVTDLHQLLPELGLHIVGEHFLPIAHQLLVLPGTLLTQVKVARSHPQALGQCRKTLQKLGIMPEASDDTAAAARRVAEGNDPQVAAIASVAAAQLYGLESLQTISDSLNNTTRFLILQRTPVPPPPLDVPCIMSFVFETRNSAAALYKALGGFATAGINLLKLESYQPNGLFAPTLFYAEAEAHPQAPATQSAFAELRLFSEQVQIFGVYAAHKFRRQ